MKRVNFLLAFFSLVLGGLLFFYPSSADAVFPGFNGKILFNRDGQLWTMNSDGSNQQILTTGIFSCCGHWSGDGSQVVFQRGDGNIWKINEDGSGLTQLTTDPAFDNVPSFSPDGTQIVYNSFRNNQREVRLMNADGTGDTFVDIGTGPIYSPDGEHIAYMTFNGEVRVRNLTDNTFENIIEQDGIDAPDDWSPDGTKIVFFHELDGVTSWHVVDVATHTTTQVSNLGTPNNDGVVRYSPDGTRFLFQSERASTDGSSEIFTMNTDGTDVVQLTDFDGFNGASDWQSTDIPPTTTLTPTPTPTPSTTCNGLTPTILGTTNDDNLVGTSGPDVIMGLGGNDTIQGKQGNDTICGGEGIDDIDGDFGNDYIEGNADDDTINGNQNDDVIVGGLGSDNLFGGLGIDTIDGNDGNDTIEGNQNDDTVNGGAGNDNIIGGLGSDILNGNADDDSIEGNQGADFLDGGTGTNTLDGGNGTDTCQNGSTTSCEL